MSLNDSAALHVGPTPDILLTISDISAYLNLLISPVFYGVAIWIVHNKSPRAMGAYKWYVMANTICFAILELMYSLAHPEPLFPHPVLLGRGLAQLHHPADIYVHLFADFAILVALSVGYFTIAQFLFRYCQTADNWMHRVLSDPKYAVLMYLGSMVLDTLLVIVPLHTQWASRDELLDYLRVADAELYEKAQKHTVVGIKHVKTRLYYISYCSAITLALTATVVGLWSTFGCYRYLRQNRSWISERTAALYRILINALVIEAFLGGALVIMPALVSLMAFNAGYGYGATIALMSFTVVNWYPLAAHVVLVTYIRPYRIALSQLLQLGRKSSILPQMTGTPVHKTVASSH